MSFIRHDHLSPRRMCVEKQVNSNAKQNTRRTLVDEWARQIQDGNFTVKEVISASNTLEIKVRIQEVQSLRQKGGLGSIQAKVVKAFAKPTIVKMSAALDRLFSQDPEDLRHLQWHPIVLGH
jgi:hypothetical protein